MAAPASPSAGGRWRIGLLDLDGTHRVPLACVHDALLAANAWLGSACYEVFDIAPGAATAPSDAAPWSGLFVAATSMPDPGESPPDVLRHNVVGLDPAQGVLAGIGTGVAWLLAGGWMAGTRCTIQIDAVDALLARHPDRIVTRGIYELQGNRMSCAGGLASLDMAIAWLAARHGQQIVPHLLTHFGLSGLRAPGDRQPSQAVAGMRLPPKLAEAVALMQANIAEPLSAHDVATLVGVSRRQLERLFRQHMDALPSRWYLERRLLHAQSLLRNSSQSILQIGLSCGFASGAHFSNAYRSYFGHTPREERTPRPASKPLLPPPADDPGTRGPNPAQTP